MVTCDKCKREFKSPAALGGHKKYCNKNEIAEVRTSPPLTQLEGEVATPPRFKEVEFRSPRVKGLKIIITPSFYNKIETPTGTRTLLVPGKVAEFRNGVFKTSDPEIIERLSKYSNQRYPIVNMSEMREGMK